MTSSSHSLTATELQSMQIMELVRHGSESTWEFAAFEVFRITQELGVTFKTAVEYVRLQHGWSGPSSMKVCMDSIRRSYRQRGRHRLARDAAKYLEGVLDAF